MYTRCMFCKKPLGSNEVIEPFPVGRRLAFDAAKGRLWVVCRKCERWNLTPLEERWEAVEECERVFRDTRLRVSTDNIGLARHPEGLTLVRVGKPMRPEFAAWRYGDQFGRRRRKSIALWTGGVAAVGALTTGGLLAGALTLSSVHLPLQAWNLWYQLRSVVKAKTREGKPIAIRGKDLFSVRLGTAREGGGLRLEIDRVRPVRGNLMLVFEGEEAQRLAGVIVPALNPMGGKTTTVRDAVGRIEAVGHPEAFLSEVVRKGHEWRHRWVGGERKMVIHGGEVARMPAPTRLALEMALHEEQERRALEGELWLLERAWKEAEEIAAISDGLLLPRGADDHLQEHQDAHESSEDLS